jgi:hypothetical protein
MSRLVLLCAIVGASALGFASPAPAQEPAGSPAVPAPTAPTASAAPAPPPVTDLTATPASVPSPAPAEAKPADATAKPADDAAKSAEAKPTDPASIKVERTASGAKLFRITEGLVVEGQMQKPAAFYVLRRAAIPYDLAELGKSFLPKIGAAVKAPPF